MAGNGPLPKTDDRRNRRNVATSAARLPSEKSMRAAFRGKRGKRLPKLLALAARPDGEKWQPRTLAWWESVMTSPMSTQYLESDRHGLYFAFVMIDEFYREAAEPRETKGRINRMTSLGVEVRQQIAKYGLTPGARLSLHWGVEPDEEEESGPTPGRGKVSNMTDYRNTLGTDGPAS